jgi:hypothetical protein
MLTTVTSTITRPAHTLTGMASTTLSKPLLTLSWTLKGVGRSSGIYLLVLSPLAASIGTFITCTTFSGPEMVFQAPLTAF